jgi:Domain of unknown function (DUF1648)
MNDRLYRSMVWILWLALPLTALQYWLVWNQLPARLATHFDVAGHPNGWMTRQTAMIFPLGMTLFLLIVFTAVLSRVRKSEAGAWAVLGLSYVVIGVVCWGNHAVINYNLYGNPVQVGPIMIVLIASALVVTAVFLGSKRGARFTTGPVIAEEVHAAPVWAMVFVVPLVAELAVIVAVPNAGLRFGLGLLTLLLAVVAVGTWDGFHYIFTQSGVEIRTLGFRLRSIPTTEIREYAVDRWNPLGGYGIRGIGEKRAYVWGNKGVRIKTTNGEVFLGHSEPERIVHDLDVIKQFRG